MNTTKNLIAHPNVETSQKPSMAESDFPDFKQNFTDCIWRYTAPPKRPIWIRLVNIIFWPLDVTAVKIVSLAIKKIPELNSFEEATNREESVLLNSVLIDSSIEDCVNLAKNWLHLDSVKLEECMAMLGETRQSLQERNWTCLQQMRQLNPELPTSFVKRPNQTWRVDPIVFSHIEWGRMWVEKTDRGDIAPESRRYKALNSQQIGELSICLRLVDLFYDMKKLERATAAYVHYRLSSIGFLKLAFLLTPLLIITSRHHIGRQIGLSLLSSTYLAGKSFQYYLKSTDAFDDLHNENIVSESLNDLIFILNKVYRGIKNKESYKKSDEQEAQYRKQKEKNKRFLEKIDLEMEKFTFINIIKKLFWNAFTGNNP